MWRYFIELFTVRNYGDFVEAAEDELDGLPLCCDPVVAIDFSSPDELNAWVKEYTSLNYVNGDYGIKGIYYPDYMEKGKH